MAINSIAPYILLDGTTREAVSFYQEAFDAELVGIQTFGEVHTDEPMDEETKDRVMHAALKIGDFRLMFSDTFPGHPFQTGSQITIAVMVDSVEESQKVFAKLSEGGNVQLPLQDTGWSISYGSLIDKYNVHWQISTE